MRYDSREAELRAILRVADLMAAAARTAPKCCGIDNLEVIILDGEEKARLAEEQRRLGAENGEDFFVRDGYNMDMADAVVLLGAKIHPSGVPDCGFCGYADCGENVKNNGICSFNIGDLGIAVGSAVSVAADHRIDNRVLFTAGKAALSLGLFSDDVRVAYGILMATSSKNMFFDRGTEDNERANGDRRTGN